ICAHGEDCSGRIALADCVAAEHREIRPYGMVPRKSDGTGCDRNCSAGGGAKREGAYFGGEETRRTLAENSSGVGATVEKTAAAAPRGDCEDGKRVCRGRCGPENHVVGACRCDTAARNCAGRIRQKSLHRDWARGRVDGRGICSGGEKRLSGSVAGT